MKYREYVIQAVFEHADRPPADWRDVDSTVDALGDAGLLPHPLDQEGVIEQTRTIGADRPVRTVWVSNLTESEEREG